MENQNKNLHKNLMQQPLLNYLLPHRNYLNYKTYYHLHLKLMDHQKNSFYLLLLLDSLLYKLRFKSYKLYPHHYLYQNQHDVFLLIKLIHLYNQKVYNFFIFL